MGRPKPAIASWIARERRRLAMKPADLRARLEAMGVQVSEQTIRVWESNADRKPSAYNIESLERVFGSQAPVDRTESPDALVAALLAHTAALVAQTDAINKLVRHYSELADAAVREGAEDARRVVGGLQGGAGSPPSSLREQRA